ncbi:hypothetical protein SNE25_09975 [Mucilaginibacter sabulilitoris]|uniref:Peptidase S74 domain-containing protein n=1 Tax=Mucilaginibacter sabulilitoris TaxID=1173583 RepID=A0ABZ0TSE5_9SPHI|nr:hypothetical protein [Mucilaginibacter sabulilitoris]WPU95844.1 hypothetical protein SNE25_09975 [Mucilaginibacter sabulilitoris]
MKKGYLTIVTILIFLQSARAQWTLSGTNVSNSPVTSNVQIGLTTPTVINSSVDLFPSAIPKLEILTANNGSTAYSELITLRHTGVSQDALSRQLGMLFKLSNEANTGESGKMGGMMLESSSAWANHISLSLITANARRMTIDENGYVGINLTNPTARLSVNSGLSAPTTINLANSIVIGSGNANASYKYLGQFGFLSNDADFSAPKIVAYISGEATEVYTDDTKTGSVMRFFTGDNGGSNPVERMVIDNRGYVGIGTATPKETLSVNGNIRAKQIKVEITNWPDYVFQKGYQLPSLQEVKTYIDQNQHLPEIPSEEQITKQGLNLGEMNKLLMKKVEELTLYLIEKDKTEQEQKEINNKQSIEIQRQKDEAAKQAQLQDARIKHLEERLNQFIHLKKE